MSSRTIASEVVFKETTMYANILIPTDGRNSPQRQSGTASRGQAARCQSYRADGLGALSYLHGHSQMIEDTPAQYKARMQEHAEEILGTMHA
jgi:hypothetical protein